MQRWITLALLAFAMSITAASGCASGRRKLHLVSESPYLDARTGQIVELDYDEDDEDESIGGWFVSELFSLFWDAIFDSDDESTRQN